MHAHLKPGIGILITNDGAHTPESWAEATASGLVHITPDMPADRLVAAAQARKTTRDTLVEAFRNVTATTTTEAAESLASGAMSQITTAFAATPWAMSVEHPQIAAEMKAYITRNLLSAADVAAKVGT